jgi:DNA modification methylase
MTPYYTDDLVTLYLGDCREVTDWLSADVLVTDPPYGMAYESNFNRDKRNVKIGRPVAGDQTTALRDEIIREWAGGPALVFGRWNCPRPAGVRHRLIWDKGNTVGMGDLSMPWGPTDEEVYVLGSGFVGPRESNVLRVQMLMSGDHRRPDHPTPKPVPLMERLIEKCRPGTIADPFAGSGSTLVAAKNLGRKAIGVELEERYCEIAARRLAQDVLDFEGATA